MLTAKDFKYIYKTGKLPPGLQLLNSKIPSKSDKISNEWISLENKLNSLAKSFIENRDSRKTYPPFFNLNIKYSENVNELRKLGYIVFPLGGLQSKSFESRPYQIEFLKK